MSNEVRNFIQELVGVWQRDGELIDARVIAETAQEKWPEFELPRLKELVISEVVRVYGNAKW